jgi:hypothetical protein
MSYFRELPNVDYQSFLQSKSSSLEYIRVKNLFRRVKLRDDLQNVFTLFNKYQIEEGERPDTVAEKLYGAADLDWVVLITAGIINVRNDWPLSDKDIYYFTEEKYGFKNVNEIHHYETTEVRDSKGRLILPKGKIVSENFTIPDPDDPYAVALNPVAGISNYEYEVIKNNEKRTIYILRSEYLQQYLNDMREIMYYDESSQYVDERLIKTENTRISLP